MRAKRVIVGIVVLAVGLAYVAGYWPEHRRRVALEVDAESLRERSADSEARVRVGRLLGEALNIREAVGSLNCGNAQQLSSTFFDGVRAEASITPVAPFKTALEAVLQARDQVTRRRVVIKRRWNRCVDRNCSCARCSDSRFRDRLEDAHSKNRVDETTNGVPAGSMHNIGNGVPARTMRTAALK